MNIFKFLRRAPKPPLMTGYIYEQWCHASWGDNIEWNGTDRDRGVRKIVGWLNLIPHEGDELRYEMESGKIARGRIQDVRRCSDVNDMFFADILEIGYVGETPINEVLEVGPDLLKAGDTDE